MSGEIADFATMLAVVNAATSALVASEGDDVGRVKQLVGAMGQSFTTTMFAYHQAGTLKDGIIFIAGLAEKFPNEAWLGTVAAEQFRKPVHTLTTRYAMKDTAALHEAAAKLAPALSGAELLALCRAFITYYTRLVRRLFDLLPIHELAAVFEGANLMAARQKTSVTGRGVEG